MPMHRRSGCTSEGCSGPLEDIGVSTQANATIFQASGGAGRFSGDPLRPPSLLVSNLQYLRQVPGLLKYDHIVDLQSLDFNLAPSVPLDDGQRCAAWGEVDLLPRAALAVDQIGLIPREFELLDTI